MNSLEQDSRAIHNPVVTDQVKQYQHGLDHGLEPIKSQYLVRHLETGSQTEELAAIQLQNESEQGILQEQHTEEMFSSDQWQLADQREREQLVMDVIKQRRSVGQLTKEVPSRQQIERLLEAATYAPNHHVAESWRFFVVTGAAREELGALMAASLRMNMQKDLAPEKKKLLLWREREKPLRAPVIITIAVPGSHDTDGLFIENVEAAAAATQNMLLVAEAMGLATLWRTGDTAYDPLIKRWFGLVPEDHIVGFVYVGYPKMRREMRVPTPFAQKTVWIS